jgi:hypothetical protein
MPGPSRRLLRRPFCTNLGLSDVADHILRRATPEHESAAPPHSAQEYVAMTGAQHAHVDSGMVHLQGAMDDAGLHGTQPNHPPGYEPHPAVDHGALHEPPAVHFADHSADMTHQEPHHDDLQQIHPPPDAGPPPIEHHHG